MEPTPVADRSAPASDVDGTEPEARCPVPHGLAAALPGCPVPHGATATAPVAPVERSKADQFVRKVLRVPERPAPISEAQANRSFQTSMLISGIRCTLTYIVFPIIIPLIGIAKGVEAPLGIAIGTFAIVCDVFTIRRFFAADHRYRWWFSGIALSIIVLLFILLAEDIIALFG